MFGTLVSKWPLVYRWDNLFQAECEPDVSTDNMNKAKGFLKILQSKVMVVFGHFLWDVTAVLNKLSLSFQRHCTAAVDAHTAIGGAMTALEKLKTK